MDCKSLVFLVFFLFGFAGANELKAQGRVDSELAVSAYAGGSYLPANANHLSASYYEDLRLGVNFGGQAILFFGKIGIGFNYDQSSFSASGEEIGSYVINEDYSFRFFGPVFASRIEVNSTNQIVFTFAFGQSAVRNNAVIDGRNFTFEDDDFVPRIAITYNYKFSDFAFNAGIQFINEKVPLPQSLVEVAGTGRSEFQYESGTNFDRLGLSIGFSYHISNLF